MTQTDNAIDELLVQQILGEPLSPQDRARLDDALAADPALRAEAASLRQVYARMGESVAVEAPAQLRDRIIASVAAQVAPASAPSRRASSSAWPYALAASVTLFALAASIFLFAQNRQLRASSAQQSAAANMLLEPNIVRSFTLRGSGAAQDATGIVMLDLDAKRASIALRDLPAAPAGQAYFLWAELEDKRVPCGSFQPLPDGTVLTQFRIPVDSYTSPILRLVMTLQPQDDAPRSDGAAVMSSS